MIITKSVLTIFCSSSDILEKKNINLSKITRKQFFKNSLRKSGKFSNSLTVTDIEFLFYRFLGKEDRNYKS